MLLVMVAAGATVLMAASEENLVTETGNGIAHSINQSTCSQYDEIRCGKRNIESPVKGDVATCSSNISKYNEIILVSIMRIQITYVHTIYILLFKHEIQVYF